MTVGSVCHWEMCWTAQQDDHVTQRALQQPVTVYMHIYSCVCARSAVFVQQIRLYMLSRLRRRWRHAAVARIQRLIGKRMLQSDAQSRLVAQCSAQLCIPPNSLLPLLHLWRHVSVYVCVRVCLYMVRIQRISLGCKPSTCVDKWGRSSGEGYGWQLVDYRSEAQAAHCHFPTGV